MCIRDRDCTLQTGVQVSCNEAMLTGESLPAAKQPGDRLYMGCMVMTGRGEGVVTATGMETEMGKIAGMMETAGEEPTPLQQMCIRDRNICTGSIS